MIPTDPAETPPPATVVADAASVDRTPTTPFDAIVGLALDKAALMATPIVAARLKKIGLPDAEADQKASNLCTSVKELVYDVADLLTSLRNESKTAAVLAA